MSVEITKRLWESKTIWGVVIMVLAAALQKYGIEETDVTKIVTAIAEIGGAVLAIYGRIAASKKVTLSKGTP